MSPPPPTSLAERAAMDEVLDLVRARGGRVTAARRLLIQALFANGEHRRAEDLAAEVQEAAPDVAMSTIYRNLDELERLGVVVHSHFGHGPATYHLANRAHGHLVCEHCGETIEMADGALVGLVRSAWSDHGFEVNPYHFAIPGRCARCAGAGALGSHTPHGR